MTAHGPDHEPLDTDELALARVLRALPAGEPSPALDARVLKAASNAVAAAPSRRIGWLAATGPLWSIGSAAAAVLAIGIAWHAFEPPTRVLPATSPAPISESIDHGDATTVEFRDRAPLPLNLPPPAAPRAMPAPQQALKSAPPTQGEPAAAAQSLPLDEAVPRRATPTPVISDATAPSTRAMAAPTRESPATAEMAGLAKSAVPSTQPTLNGMIESADAALARVRPDARRYPESWLLKIRARRSEGDLTGARASLALFRRTYPHYRLPEDLQSLAEP